SSPFSFEGRIPRLPYALGSLAVFFSQYAAVYAVAKAQGRGDALDWWLAGLSPLRAAVTYSATSDALLIAGLAYFLIAASALAARRAADGEVSEWIALLAIGPTLQIAAIAILSVVPSRGAAAQSASANPVAAAPPVRAATALGLLTGTGLTLFAVAVGALLF